MPRLPRLLAVLDPALAMERGLDPLLLGRAILDAGARFLWLRDHPREGVDLSPLRAALRADVRAAGAYLVRSDLRAALEEGAGDGLHLSAAALASVRHELVALRAAGHVPLGASLHGGDMPTDPALAALDYATLSPLRTSDTKPGYGPPLGMDALLRFADAAPFSVYALGGARPDDLRHVGPRHGIAMMGPLHRPEPAPAIHQALRNSTPPP